MTILFWGGKVGAMATRKRLAPAKKVFIQEVTRTGNIRAAAQAAYKGRSATLPKDFEDKGRALIKNDPVVRETILAIWEAEGLTLSLAAKKHKQLLKSKSIKPQAQLKAIEMVYREHGGRSEDSAAQGLNSLAGLVSLMMQQRKQRGLPVPEGILEAEVIKK